MEVYDYEKCIKIFFIKFIWNTYFSETCFSLKVCENQSHKSKEIEFDIKMTFSN